MTGQQQDQEYRVFTTDYQFVGFISGEKIRRMLGARQICAVRFPRKAGENRPGRIRYYRLCAQLSATASVLLEHPDSSTCSVGAATALHYTESLDAMTGETTAFMVTLKKVGPDGSFVRWKADEGFRPRRWNPDTLPRPFVTRGCAAMN